ncbi:MAG: hypothetical protein NZ765_03140 [Anaerolineae bacterium]|nr:hypothetical protein [Anaerolineae bacterium]MDW8070484.1 hypothetical protein [Anaerolineae bacterium]
MAARCGAPTAHWLAEVAIEPALIVDAVELEERVVYVKGSRDFVSLFQTAYNGVIS